MADSGIDVAIVGAGPVGCALALALRDRDLKVRLLGERPATLQRAFRPLALSYASRLILERIGAWEGLPSTPIEEIHVSQAGRFGRTRLTAAELGLPALGHVIDYADIAAHLASRIDDSIWLAQDSASTSARLVVHAEGTAPDPSGGRDYGHTAIVALVESDRPAHGVAWERFTAEGPLALLPLGTRYGMVWSRASAAAGTLMACDDSEFLAELQRVFGQRAGSFTSIGPRSATPLMLRYRTVRSAPGQVYIGNAAQTLHPVAGQGLNLGLRDAWALAQCLLEAPAAELGSAGLASRFAAGRRFDAAATIRATDLMATLFVRRDPLSSIARGAALTALDLLPPARKFFARRMIYGASAW